MVTEMRKQEATVVDAAFEKIGNYKDFQNWCENYYLNYWFRNTVIDRIREFVKEDELKLKTFDNFLESGYWNEITPSQYAGKFSQWLKTTLDIDTDFISKIYDHVLNAYSSTCVDFESAFGRWEEEGFSGEGSFNRKYGYQVLEDYELEDVWAS